MLFGGVQGLEYSLECDENLKADNVADLCDLYLNLCPGQGSRTIRTEVHNIHQYNNLITSNDKVVFEGFFLSPSMSVFVSSIAGGYLDWPVLS